VIDEAYISGHISSLKKGFLEVIKRSFAQDSKLILCFICSLGTGTGLALSITSFIWNNASLGLSCTGLIISAICFAVFLYVAWKMD
jgi:hypothetical protein